MTLRRRKNFLQGAIKSVVHFQYLFKIHTFIYQSFRATYNSLEAASIKISMDLNDKNQSLETDTRALEMRAALEPKRPQGTDKNLVLASMRDELPNVEN